MCTRCFANTGPPIAIGRAPWRTFAIAGGIAGAIPFAVSASSSSSTVINGEVTSFVYRDWIAVGLGVIAIVLGAIAVAAARKEQLQRGLAFAAGLGVMLLGGAQVARGFGVFATPDDAGSMTRSSFSIEPTVPMPSPAEQTPAGCADAQRCFDLGLALAKSDPKGSTVAFERSCELGASGGCFNAGLYWLEQEPPELEKANKLFTKACEADDAKACNHAGRIAATDGPTKDLARAKAMFEKACDGGDPQACSNLGIVYDQGLGVEQDETKARAQFEKACGGKVADACFFLGEMRARGIGGKKDPAGAKSAYKDACDAGNQRGCQALTGSKR